MVRTSIRMIIPSRKRDEVMEILSSMAERARFEPGCISCRLNCLHATFDFRIYKQGNK